MSLRKSVRAFPYNLANSLIGTKGTSNRPIFVTGNGRSGTSWIGETLGRAANVLYYREPCHPRRNGLPPDQAETVWCRYVRPGARDGYFEATLDAAFRGQFWPGSGYRLLDYRTRLAHRPQVIVKEIAAFLSVEWVVERWKPAVVIILRHPGAYAASVRNLKQDDEEVQRFRLLCASPGLRHDHLEALGPHVEAVQAPLEASIASWAIRTSVVLEALHRHPEWLVVHYEDIARDPLSEFQKLYRRLGLTWDSSIEGLIRRKINSDSGGNYSTSRIAASRIDAWRSQLTADETLRVRRVLEPFGLPIYNTAADWSDS